MQPDHQQWYLRAEPSEEGRILLRDHQEHLRQLSDHLHLSPRFTPARELHWTALFLDAPRRWRDTLHNPSVQLPALAEYLVQRMPAAGGSPTAFDVFFTVPTRAVFVLRMDTLESVTQKLLAELQDYVHAEEREGRVAASAAEHLLHDARSPIAREVRKKKAHITLARGTVSRARQRDVARTLRTAELHSRAPIHFSSSTVRAVGHTQGHP